MKNIKRFAFIIALIIAVSSMLCVGASAHEHTDDCEHSEYPEAPVFDTVIDTQEIVITIPEMYQYYPISEQDVYYMFSHGNTADSFFVDVQVNDCAPNGITALDEQKIKDIFVLRFLSEGDATSAKFYEMTYDEFKVETINGVKMYKLQGTYVWNDGSFTEEELSPTGFCCYMTATKESVYFISNLYEVANTTQALKDIKEIIATAYVNGIFFEGDKTTSEEDFSAKRPFAKAVSEDATEYLSAYYDDGLYEDAPLNEEELAEYRGIVRIVCIVLIVVSAVPTLAVIIVAIVLIVKHGKHKKKLKELEERLAPAPVISYNAPQTGAYNAPADTNNQ